MAENNIGIENGLSNRGETRGVDVDRMLSFTGIYPRSQIEEDILSVQAAEKRFKRDNNMRGKNEMGEKTGDNLEFVIDRCAEQNNWFGENSFLTRTLKYDDYFNGVDFVLEYDTDENGPKRLALMVDCTMSQDNMDKKISRNLSILGQTRIKYFESQIDGSKGEIFCVPVVIGLDENSVFELLDNLKNNHYLENSPAQIAFLEEIRMQLRLYRHVLSNKIGGNTNVSWEVEDIQRTISAVLNEKEGLAKADNTRKYIAKDKVFQQMELVVEQKRNPR